MIEKWVVDASSLIILGKLSLLNLLTHLSDELIPEVKPILDKMIEAGFRIKSNLYQKVLEITNE